MNKTVVKSKTKKYYIKHAFHKKTTLPFDLKGFICSCNGREIACFRESYNLLNEYLNKLYPHLSETEPNIQDLLGDVSLSHQDSVMEHFQKVDSGTKNFLFMKTTLQDPVELAHYIVKDIHESGIQKTRFLLRLIPVEVTCKADVGEIVNKCSCLAEKHFTDLEQSYCVIFNHRNNNVISRANVIRSIADMVRQLRPNYKVDLKAAKLAIVVEIIKGTALLSIVPDYLKYKKFNLLSHCRQE